MKNYDPILDMLACTQAMTLATMDPDVTPRATPLYFAYDESLRLIFLSDPDSDHVKNLARSALCAVGLFPEVEDWKQIHGLQMKGKGEIVPEHQLKAAMDCYRNRFPFISSLAQIVLGSKLYWFSFSSR